MSAPTFTRGTWGGETVERFADPRAGDLFHEMYSFWMRVVHVTSTWLVVEELQQGWDDWRPRFFTSHEQFRKAYAYSSIQGYWVMYQRNIPPNASQSTLHNESAPEGTTP